MSTTTDIEIALRYSARGSGGGAACVLLRISTSSFMSRGADISSLSCFPAEAECLFPPLTFLQPVGSPETVMVDQTAFTVMDVQPHL